SRYPFSVNTDDPGVFETNLSSEYAHLAKAHGLDKASMAELACRALEVSWNAASAGLPLPVSDDG
ncbi:unnamed protein product, partial [Discosporangium mesarthrocarpum]